MAVTKQLSDLNAELATMTKGTLITGDGSTPLAAGWYLVNAKATSSALPSGTTLKVPFYTSETTGHIVTPAIGDKVYPITFTCRADCQGVNLDLTKDELESTVLCSEVKTYLAGRVDASGSFNGVTTVGVSEDLAGKFFDSVVQETDGTQTMTSINNEPIFLQISTNKASIAGESIEFYLFPAILLSFTAGADNGAIQTFETNFRITQHDEVAPVFFELKQSAV